MSGSLSSLSSALSAVVGWRVLLRPASFRGVPFYLNTAEFEGGRRLVTHEYPLRDDPALEDLGQKANRWRFNCFVVGSDFLIYRDALIAACQDYDTPATLVHPTMGGIQCRAGELRCTENPRDLGGYASFEIEFRKEGLPPGLVAGTDTVSQLLNGVASMLKLGLQAYVLVNAIIRDPALLLGYAGGLLDAAGLSVLGLPASTILGLGAAVGGIGAALLDSTATAGAVQSVYQAAAQNVIIAQTPPAAAQDAVLGASPAFARPADLTGGLATMAVWGDTVPQPTGAGAALAAKLQQRAAIVALVEGSATLAVLTVYAATNFTSANAAADARVQVLDLLDRQAAAANKAGQDDLYRGWLALTGLAVNDLIQRAQNLPQLIGYQVNATMPSVVLSQLFYPSADRGDEMEALNDAPHPMFMPAQGVRLSV